MNLIVFLVWAAITLKVMLVRPRSYCFAFLFVRLVLVSLGHCYKIQYGNSFKRCLTITRMFYLLK